PRPCSRLPTKPLWIRRKDTPTQIDDADDRQPPGPNESGPGANVLPGCCEEKERSPSQAEERERHQPANAAQLEFADQMGRVELWLQHMKHGEDGQERDT